MAGLQVNKDECLGAVQTVLPDGVSLNGSLHEVSSLECGLHTLPIGCSVLPGAQWVAFFTTGERTCPGGGNRLVCTFPSTEESCAHPYKGPLCAQVVPIYVT